MRLFFVGCRPGSTLETTLQQHSLVHELRTLAAIGVGQTDLIVWKLQSPQELSHLKNVRLSHPQAWIALVIPDAWLSTPNHYADILGNLEKDDVWLESSWENGFWIALQRALQSRVVRSREAALQAEVEKIREEQDALLKASTSLIERLEQSVEMASQVHRKMYPRFSPDVPGVQVFSKYLPASGTGGDYFDIFEFGDKKRFGFLLADGTSHRTAAALLSVLLRLRLDDLKGQFSDSASFVRHLNNAILAELPKSTGTLKLAYGVFDRSSLNLDLTLAGALHPRIFSKHTVTEVQATSNGPLTQSDTEWKSVQIQMQPGQTFVLFSDGLEQAWGGGTGKIDAFLDSAKTLSDPLEVRNRLLAEVDALKTRAPLKDDLTFILLNVDEKALYVQPAIPLKRR